MAQSLICMTLTGKTLAEDSKLVEKYAKKIDLVELRTDHLTDDEQLYIRRFPAMINKPCILTIRRDIDGGNFTGGEFSRTTLFGRALSFAEETEEKNFAYVDFEEDYHVPSIEDAAQAFDIRVIRSFHDMKGPVYNIKEKCNSMRKTGYEIPKIAFMPKTLHDVTNLFKETADFTDYDHILCAMGPMGLPSRLLADRTHSFLSFVSPAETEGNTAGLGHIDPNTLNDLYRFRQINNETSLYGITGWPLAHTGSPKIHNQGYIGHDLNAMYLPVRGPQISEVIEFAELTGIKGMSVTVPHKTAVMNYLSSMSEEVEKIEACNTIVRENGTWVGYNTDAYGFRRSLEEFLGVTKLRHKKVAIIGAGGVARAIAYVIKQMGGKACVFNRTLANAKILADKYGFDYAELGPTTCDKLEKYSDLIIQTTSVGMNCELISTPETDPIYFYNFKGHEAVFDLIYTPPTTPIMKRAFQAGCRTCNGAKMLQYQGYMQFKLFTGMDYEK